MILESVRRVFRENAGVIYLTDIHFIGATFMTHPFRIHIIHSTLNFHCIVFI